MPYLKTMKRRWNAEERNNDAWRKNDIRTGMRPIRYNR